MCLLVGLELQDLWNQSCEYVSLLCFPCDVMCDKILYISLNFEEFIGICWFVFKEYDQNVLNKIIFCMHDILRIFKGGFLMKVTLC